MTNKQILDVIPAPPAGYRYMTAHEGESLAAGDPIVLMTPGGMEHALVRGFTDEAMTVTLRSGAIVTLDLDNPDYWPDSESRDRRPPMDVGESIVALHSTEATPDDEIEPLMRTGVALAAAAKDDPELAAAVAEVRRILAKRLRGRAA